MTKRLDVYGRLLELLAPGPIDMTRHGLWRGPNGIKRPMRFVAVCDALASLGQVAIADGHSLPRATSLHLRARGDIIRQYSLTALGRRELEELLEG